MLQIATTRPELRQDTPEQELQGNRFPDLRISFGDKKAQVDLSLGPTGLEHFDNRHNVTYFGTTGWFALRGSEKPDRVTIEYPWRGEACHSRTGFNRNPNAQVLAYISGVNPRELQFEAISGFGSTEGPEHTPLDVVHEEGEFRCPLGLLVPGTEPVRWQIFTDRAIVPGVAGLDGVVVYSASQHISAGRQIQ